MSEQIDELSKSTLANYMVRAGSDRASEGRKEIIARHMKGDDKAADAHAHKDKKRFNGMMSARKRLAAEEVQIDELSKPLLDKYRDRAYASVTAKRAEAAKHENAATDSHSPEMHKGIAKMHHAKAKQRLGSIKVADKKVMQKIVTREEVEQIDEISTKLADSYLKKAVDSNHNLKPKRVAGATLIAAKELKRQGINVKGARAAKVALTKEEAEQIDELGPTYSKPAKVPQRPIKPGAAKKLASIADKKGMDDKHVQHVLFNQGHGRKSEKMVKDIRSKPQKLLTKEAVDHKTTLISNILEEIKKGRGRPKKKRNLMGQPVDDDDKA